MTETPMKQCSRKEQCVHPEGREGWLPATNVYFAKSNRSKDGWRPQCKACHSLYYQRDKERIKERSRQYAEDNKEAIREWRQQHYQENRDRILVERKQYNRQNKDAISVKNKRNREVRGDAIRQQQREHYALNRERIREQQRQHYAANREQYAQRNKESRERNRAKIAQDHKRYYAAHKDQIQARQNRWRHENRHKDAAIKRRYKGRKRNAPGTHTGADIALLFKAQGGNCWWCGKPLPDNYHVDHVIALNRGGTNDAKNLCLACPSCNCSKKDKLPSEWIGRLF